MKVILFSPLFPSPNNHIAGIFNLNRVQALKQKGIEVIVISPIGLTPKKIYFLQPFKIISNIIEYKKILLQKNEYYVEGIRVLSPKWMWLPRTYFWSLECILLRLFAGRQIKNEIINFNPDLIITSWIYPYGVYAKYIRKYFNGKIFSISEGSDLLINPERFWGWAVIKKWINKYIDVIIYVSNAHRKTSLEKRGIKDGFIVNNGFLNEKFYFVDRKRMITNDCVRIITVGNLWDIKGHDLLLEAMTRLNKKYELYIIGEGEKRSEYEKFIKLRNLNDRVKLIGRVHNSELQKYFCNADIYCMPSRSESFGLAVVEALATGLPAITSDLACFKEIIEPNVNGLIFRSEDIDDMIEKIENASKIKWDKIEIAKNAYLKYSIERWADKIIKIYKEDIQ